MTPTRKLEAVYLMDYKSLAPVPSQLGILNSPVATAGAGAAVKLLKRSTQRG
jgi:hypothetical protein